MYPSVQAAWLPFTKKLEGYLTYMYLDALGYASTGAGNLIDPSGLALSLPWKNPDGSLASQDQILSAWNAVDALRSDPKGQRQTSGPATHYGQAFAGYTTIRLDDEGILQLVDRQIAANEAMLRKYFPNYDSLPADAQMAILSMSWAMGAGFPRTFTQFTAAVNNNDFATAKANADFRGVGVQTRIDADKQMLQNAADVVAQGLDHSVLYYPGTVGGGFGGGGGGPLATITQAPINFLHRVQAMPTWQKATVAGVGVLLSVLIVTLVVQSYEEA